MFGRLGQFLTTRFGKHPSRLNNLEGKLLLVGVTFTNPSGEIEEQFQTYGRVIRASENEGVVIRKGDATGEFVLPPYPLEAYTRARAGEYRLSESGALIVDPDFTTAWTMDTPAPKREAIRQHGMMGGFEAGPDD